MKIDPREIARIVEGFPGKLDPSEKARLEKGIQQVAGAWTAEDGSPEELTRFCQNQFLQGEARDRLLLRFEEKLELIRGHFSELSLGLRREMDEDTGELMQVDRLFAEYSPDAHVKEDLFKNKLAFSVLLNFPLKTFEQTLAEGSGWSRLDWAQTRLGQGFAQRVPAEVNQKIARAYAMADDYISSYNILMDHVVGADGKPVFRDGLKLISHWGLRDELKGLYVNPARNLSQQELIYTIMERIISQQIPQSVIGNPRVKWDPQTNLVDGQSAEREPDTRFQKLLQVFQAHRLEDPYYPATPTHIDRRFKLNREIALEDFVALLESVLKAPVSRDMAATIQQRLGRPLRPFDIWYNGFKPRGRLDETELDRIVQEKYPNLEAFQKDLPNVLKKLGFDRQTARFLAEHIEVDPARGAGHAWGPAMRSAKARLRTRVPQGGMNYQGFNVAMHELGHNVEQVFSLYKVDHTLLSGVPNTAFTEGFAFVFQARDLDILGLAKPDRMRETLGDLDQFWATREIAGVGLVDIQVWRWLYDHPAASPAELGDAVTRIAKDVWNAHYASIFGVPDSPILAIYSHMINSGLYLPDYPLGHIIAFQVEDYFKTHKLAKEMERMCAIGSVSPGIWMLQAIGGPISAQPLIQSAEKSLKLLKKSTAGVPQT